ncbi:MAG: 7-carboxy-7-deazaguanine synthase QueE [Candidatus Melainabacteria bacterium]|nr:7-carboxy-7-deazaguanine synthase QueE [Candidatus Melainabacteria bacterium]
MVLSSPPTAEGTPRLAAISQMALIQEVFSSVQGEGPYVGVRQIFVRGAKCHLKCAYCDTPMETPDGRCYVAWTPGSADLEPLENPLSPETILAVISRLNATAKHHSVSFTGGEPLLYHRWLACVLPGVRSLGLKTYLETSGTQPELLHAVLPHTDIVAMDIKLPSATGEAPLFTEHAQFYKAVRQRPQTELFVKVVFNANTSLEELRAIEAVLPDRHIPIFLQPETTLDLPYRVRVRPADIFRVQDTLNHFFHHVRVIPQTHKLLAVQ